MVVIKLATYPVTSKDVDMPAGPLQVKRVDISVRGFTLRELTLSAMAEAFRIRNEKVKIEAKEVEGILARIIIINLSRLYFCENLFSSTRFPLTLGR